jgi:hypothetical protein
MRVIKNEGDMKELGLSEDDALQLLSRAAKAGDTRARENLTIATARMTSRSETSRSEPRRMPRGIRRPPPLSDKGKYVSIMQTQDDSGVRPTQTKPMPPPPEKLPEKEPIVVINPTGAPHPHLLHPHLSPCTWLTGAYTSLFSRSQHSCCSFRKANE